MMIRDPNKKEDMFMDIRAMAERYEDYIIDHRRVLEIRVEVLPEPDEEKKEKGKDQ